MHKPRTRLVNLHCLLAVWLLLPGWALWPQSAFAHQVHLSVHVHGNTIHGEAHYPDDRPVKNAKVTAFDPVGKKLGETTTDQQGEFQLQAQSRCDHRLLVGTGDGHVEEYTVAAARLPKSPSPDEGLQDAENYSIYRELCQLRDELDEFKRQTHWRDVIGTIGYIFGLAGVAFYFLGVRKRVV